MGMSAAFTVDPAFEPGSVFAADWPLCQVRLQTDARFPWLILIPRQGGLRELEDLSAHVRGLLMEEVVRAGHMVRRLGDSAGRPVHKLNVAALGNVTSQLHVHVVGRRPDDGVWPEPIWGRGAPLAYAPEALKAALALVEAS